MFGLSTVGELRLPVFPKLVGQLLHRQSGLLTYEFVGGGVGSARASAFGSFLFLAFGFASR